MESVDQYEHHSAIQLATETAFISWVKCPDADSDLFWKTYVSQYPLKKDTVDKARTIVLQMRIVNETMDEKRAAVVWRAVSERVERRVIFIRRWMVAAAVLVFLVFGLWFLVGRDKVEKPSLAVVPRVEQDITPGGDKAVLTLADGSQVVLDTAGNGALTKQGNVTVIKLDGKLAYQSAASNATTEVTYNTITTPRGGQFQLELADGSKVWLNAASSFRFPTAFTGKERRVELTGEGYFEVAHNASQPFIVGIPPSGGNEGGMDVQVLGTHFNINAYSDEPSVNTTLLEGRVLVKKNDKHVYLNPGQQAVLQTGQDAIRVNYDVDVEEVVAWKNGYFLFDSANIETVMRQVARWYDVNVVYQGRTDETTSGSLPRSQALSQLVKILEATGKLDLEIRGKQVIVKPK